MALWLAAVSSVMRTLIHSRGSSGLNRVKNSALLGLFRLIARRGDYFFRDRVLSWFAPVAIVTSLIMWLLMFFLAYGLIMYSTTTLPFMTQLREAGSSLFTLGYASTDRATLTAMDFVAAATGPIVIGLLIGYLPTFYSAYQRRESEATVLADDPAVGRIDRGDRGRGDQTAAPVREGIRTARSHDGGVNDGVAGADPGPDVRGRGDRRGHVSGPSTGR